MAADTCEIACRKRRTRDREEPEIAADPAYPSRSVVGSAEGKGHPLSLSL